jgi:hypothetical protein
LQIHFDEWPAARFRFHPLPLKFQPNHNCTGEFSMLASVNGSKIAFEPGSWISNPCGYYSLGLEGVFDNGGEDLGGNITTVGCTTFQTSLHGIALQECEHPGENRSCVELPRMLEL